LKVHIVKYRSND